MLFAKYNEDSNHSPDANNTSAEYTPYTKNDFRWLK